MPVCKIFFKLLYLVPEKHVVAFSSIYGEAQECANMLVYFV